MILNGVYLCMYVYYLFEKYYMQKEEEERMHADNKIENDTVWHIRH